MKQQEESRKDILGQISFTEDVLSNTTEKGAEQPQEELCETCIHNGECAGKKAHGSGCMGYEPEEYEDPQPENIISLCYSCDNYETCHEKKSIVTSCNIYVNRKEAHKTDKQRYDEQQVELDRETARKLKERQQLPNETEKKIHEIPLAASKYNEIANETLTFYLLKNDGYRVGDTAIMKEYTAGRTTGREMVIEIIYIWKDWAGLKDDYCIISFTVQKLSGV